MELNTQYEVFRGEFPYLWYENPVALKIIGFKIVRLFFVELRRS